MFAALLPLVLTAAPWLAEHIFGPAGEAVTGQIVSAVSALTGVDPAQPDAGAKAVAALRGNPQQQQELREQLARIAAQARAEADQAAAAARQSDLDTLKAGLADTASARQASVTYAQTSSPLAYGAPLLSAIILISFAVMLYLVVARPDAIGANAALANILLGTLAAMATQVANFWLGSSAGSKIKDGTIYDAQQALAVSVPMPGAGRAP